MTFGNRVLRLKARSSGNGLEPTMLIIGIEEQRQLRADMEAISGQQPNGESYPESYQGLVIVRVSAPALLMVGNVTVEQ